MSSVKKKGKLNRPTVLSVIRVKSNVHLANVLSRPNVHKRFSNKGCPDSKPWSLHTVENQYAEKLLKNMVDNYDTINTVVSLNPGVHSTIHWTTPGTFYFIYYIVLAFNYMFSDNLKQVFVPH